MVYLTVEQMAGPTPEAKAAQHRQLVLLDAYYATYRAHPALDAPEVVAARAAYDESVRVLEEMLGPDAHCSSVDQDLWSSFSDAYKDRNNFRPRWHQTRADTLAWFKQHATYE